MPTFDRPGMDLPPAVRRKFRRRITVDGMKLKVELLPSLWIKAPFYGILVSAAGPETVHLMIRRPYARATKADFDRLVARIRTEPCSAPRCTKRYLVGDGAPRRFCPPHGLADLEKQDARERALREARWAREDARAKARGMRFKAWVWIHRDGDDVAVSRYFATRPTTAQLAKVARAHRSKLTGDWSVHRLPPNP